MGYLRGLGVAMLLAIMTAPVGAKPINMLSNSDFQQSWANWETFAITGTVWADLHPASAPGSILDAAHVTSSGRGGLVQVFLPWKTGPNDLLSSVWVYVNSGQVGMGVGNGGDTGFDATSQFTGRWEELLAKNGGVPANEFIVYAVNGADFYVTQPQVGAPVPEPESLSLLISGLALSAVLLRWCKRNCRTQRSAQS